MKLIYSKHARKRMSQKGITMLEVENLLRYSKDNRMAKRGRRIATGSVNNRMFRVVYEQKKNYKKIITIR